MTDFKEVYEVINQIMGTNISWESLKENDPFYCGMSNFYCGMSNGDGTTTWWIPTCKKFGFWVVETTTWKDGEHLGDMVIHSVELDNDDFTDKNQSMIKRYFPRFRRLFNQSGVACYYSDDKIRYGS